MVTFCPAEAKVSTITTTFKECHFVAYAKYLWKSHIRGALTTGTKWHFVLANLDTYGNGATHRVSELIEWKAKRAPNTRECFAAESYDEFDPALIAGILSNLIRVKLIFIVVGSQGAFH